MQDQKSQTSWLNTENARCHRTVYITMQNVTSKLQIGLSPEMGWYPVSFTIIVNKDVWVCTPGSCSWALFKNCRDRFVLAYTPGVLRVFCSDGFPYVIAPAFSTPAFSTPAIYCIFHSCIFHSRIFSAPNNGCKCFENAMAYSIACQESSTFVNLCKPR